MKEDRIYLDHILNCIDDIETFTLGGESEFCGSRLIQAAVIRNLEVIGEATKRISGNLRNWYPQMPWKEMAGLRDVLIHDYMGVDLEIVWNVVVDELPPIRQQLIRILSELDKNN